MIYSYNPRSRTNPDVALPHFRCDWAAELHQQWITWPPLAFIPGISEHGFHYGYNKQYFCLCVLSALSCKIGNWLRFGYYYANLYVNCLLESYRTKTNLFLRVLSHWKYFFLNSFIILDQAATYFLSFCFFWS